jgi:CxxC motif-containing protein (DUF1111 family)
MRSDLFWEQRGRDTENHVVVGEFSREIRLVGLGLVENTPDATLQANLAVNQSTKVQLGIAGSFNTSTNDGTITRFGWKAARVQPGASMGLGL